MNLNFEHYKVFYYVSKYKNLTRAARVLHISQPAVTRVVRTLEDQVGCILFVRSRNGMQHTPEGSTLFKYVSEGCKEFFKGESALNNLLDPEKGSVYITATETALHCFLFKAMEMFKDRYPDIRFKVFNNSSTESIRMIREGNADMAIISAPINVEDPLKSNILRSYGDVLIGGEQYDYLKDRELSIFDLSDLPWVSLGKDTITRNFVDEYFRSYALSFTPDIEVDTTDMILTAVKHNLGIGFIPREFALEDIVKENLIELSINQPFPEREISLIYDTEYPQSTAAKSFRAFAVNLEEARRQKEDGFRIY